MGHPVLFPAIHFASAETVLLTPDLHPTVSTVLTFCFGRISLLYVFNFIFFQLRDVSKSEKCIERC